MQQFVIKLFSAGTFQSIDYKTKKKYKKNIKKKTGEARGVAYVFIMTVCASDVWGRAHVQRDNL